MRALMCAMIVLAFVQTADAGGQAIVVRNRGAIRSTGAALFGGRQAVVVGHNAAIVAPIRQRVIVQQAYPQTIVAPQFLVAPQSFGFQRQTLFLQGCP